MTAAQKFLDSGCTLTGGRTYRDVLCDTRALLTDRDNWTQGAVARDASGEIVKPKDDSAVCWDLEGAMAYVCGDHGLLPPDLIRFMDAMAKERLNVKTDSSLWWANDNAMNHSGMLVFLDAAITET